MSAVQALMPDAIEARLQREGLTLLGHLMLADDDPLQPAGLDIQVRTLLLCGHAGSAIWPVFSASAEYRDGMPDPLDRWSERIAAQLVKEWGGKALFPFTGPPYQPFLRWAQRSGAGRSSPLGLTLHPRYGLWHGYRFALALPYAVQFTACPVSPVHACDHCLSKPCLQACPVRAFTDTGYKVAECVDFLVSDTGYRCHYQGCDARRQCPQGQGYRYTEAHAQFHMGMFISRRTQGAS